MKQLTVRGFSLELERRLRWEARRSHTSLNRAALHLLTKGAGLSDEGEMDVVGDSLNRFIGSWSDSEAEAFNDAVSELDTIDEAFWK